MPLVDYECGSCGLRVEDVLFMHSEEPHPSVECPRCSHEARRLLPLVARTAHSWGDTNSYFDRGLGAVVENRQHRDRLCKEKGLVPLQDMGSHYFEDRSAHYVDKKRKREAVTDRYVEALKRYDGDKLKAIPEAMPARECLDGSLTDTWSED